MNAIDADRESPAGELVEQRIAPIASIGDAGKRGVLPLHAQTSVSHHQHEEPCLTLREAVIDDSLNAFPSRQSHISSASPP